MKLLKHRRHTKSEYTRLDPYNHATREHAIFIAVDDRFQDHLPIFLRALEDAWPTRPILLVYYNGNQPLTREFLSTYPRATLLSASMADIPAGPVMRHLEGRVEPATFYARLLLWSDLFDQFENILHLDVDTLVLEPLDALIESSEFRMFPEIYRDQNFLFTSHSDSIVKRKLLRDGIRLPTKTGNAGVFVVPRRYRSRKSFAKICGMLGRYARHLRWADQSLINLWMANEGIKVEKSIAWNFQVRAFDSDPESFSAAKLLHFNGVADPERAQLMAIAERTLRLPYGRRLIGALFKVRSEAA
jgi:hypothetical protein